MGNKAIFLDRDGTINIDKGYMYKTEEFEFLDKAIEGLKILSDLGYILIVVTNQSGIARGYYTEEQLENLNKFMVDKLKEHGIEIKKCYYCPHHAEKGIGKYKVACNCRKPNPEMVLWGIKDFDIDVNQSYIVGDKISDAEAGLRAGLKEGVIVQTGLEPIESLEAENIENKKISLFSSLYDFAEDLLKKSKK